MLNGNKGILPLKDTCDTCSSTSGYKNTTYHLDFHVWAYLTQSTYKNLVESHIIFCRMIRNAVIKTDIDIEIFYE